MNRRYRLERAAPFAPLIPGRAACRLGENQPVFNASYHPADLPCLLGPVRDRCWRLLAFKSTVR
jgi:hypothetical protein